MGTQRLGPWEAQCPHLENGHGCCISGCLMLPPRPKRETSALIIQEPFPFLGRAKDSRHARLVSIPLERL